MIKSNSFTTHPILIQTGDKNVIIDTGIGLETQSKVGMVEYESHIKEDLEVLDMTTKDIDYVLMTHMHFDHAAGLTDKGHAIFENAIHHSTR